MRRVIEMPFTVGEIGEEYISVKDGGSYCSVKSVSREFGIPKSTLATWVNLGKVRCIPLETVYISAKDVIEMKKTYVAYTRVRKEPA